MNDKKAKALRRLAQSMTVGKVFRRYVEHHGHAINDPTSTRGAYRRLKRGLA